MKNRIKRVASHALIGLALTLCLCSTVFADTDGTEPKVTQQPDQLVLQLGTRWAGVEFELRTDAGVFPVPVVVDEYGILIMDLGGSKMYTLSCIGSNVPIPDPVPTPEEAEPPQPEAPPTAAPPVQETPQPEKAGIPTLHIVVFVFGLAAGVGGLIALYRSKRRKQSGYDEWDDEDEDF